MYIKEGKFIFTRNEALIALVVAATLVGMVFIVLSNTQVTKRDAERIDDMAEIRQALRLYKVSYGHFPVVINPVIITGTDIFSRSLLDDLIVSEVFIDPVHPDFMYTYHSDPTGGYYVLTFCLEGNAIQQFTKGCDNTITP